MPNSPKKMTVEDAAQIMARVLADLQYTGQQQRDLFRQIAKTIASNPALAAFFESGKRKVTDKELASQIESWRKANSFVSVQHLPTEVQHELDAMLKGKAKGSFVQARPGMAQGYGAGTFDYEGKDAGVKIDAHPPQLNVHVFFPLDAIGKRGQQVEMYSYQLYAPRDANKWLSMLKKELSQLQDGTANDYMRAIRSVFRSAEKESINRKDEYPVKMYEPYKAKLKAVDSTIPDRSGDQKISNRKGKDIGIRFEKPTVTIYSLSDAKEASRGFERTYIEVHWRWANKVNQLADQILGLKGLEAVKSFLDQAKVKYTHKRYADPMYQ